MHETEGVFDLVFALRVTLRRFRADEALSRDAARGKMPPEAKATTVFVLPAGCSGCEFSFWTLAKVAPTDDCFRL